jgi:ribosomal protein S18 acetylase RimI-like enzyme
MIAVRVASSPDIPVLVEMMREFYAAANYALDDGWARAAFVTLLSDRLRGMAWIVSEGETTVGYVVLTFRFSMEFGGTDAFIDDLYVRAEHRRRGAGRAALTAAFDECRRREIHALHVETGHDNAAARALYHRFGLEDRQRLLLTARLTTRRESPIG